MTSFLNIARIALLTLLLAGCSSGGTTPVTAGERIADRGETIAQYGDAWTNAEQRATEGRRLIEKGNQDAVRAERRIAQAQAEITREQGRLREAEAIRTNGERMIADGAAQMQQAEDDYEAIRSGPAAIPNSAAF